MLTQGQLYAQKHRLAQKQPENGRDNKNDSIQLIYLQMKQYILKIQTTQEN